MKPGSLALLSVLLAAVTLGCNYTDRSRDGRAAIESPPPPRPYLLHLPGIGGKRSIDRMLTEGLVQGGMDAEVEIYDWTQDDPGLSALYARQRNERQADRVAQMIVTRYRADPRTRIYLSGHSGGAGIALWALQRLPDDVKVESLLLIAPAVSPRYDLSPALRHVRGRAYALYSPHDPVLGIGTRTFGTIDGVKTDAAGRIGFTMPETGEARQYEKLVLIGYDSAWIRLGNIGDHIGAMMRPFAREILAPLFRTGVLRQLAEATTRPATTRPATTRATTGAAR
ncbi:MAG: hypothetical protein WBD40_15025 [Tepidisphaeraceae bacterium]